MAKRKKRLVTANEIFFMVMLLPAIILLICFSYMPMGGIVMAFQNFVPAKGIWGSDFIGLKNFRYMFELPAIRQVLFNTIYIASFKMILGIIVPVWFALFLNEVRHALFKRTSQTIVYLPYFLSWVILGTTFKQMFSLNGVVNAISGLFGAEPMMFLSNNTFFPWFLILTDIWKGFGFGTIIYLAAITNINPELYESAEMDGGGRWKKMWYITLPGITTTIVLLSTLSLGGILEAGFTQVFAMYNTLVYPSSDIIDTYVYRNGIFGMRYGFSTAVGLFKSVISFVLVISSYKLAEHFADYRIF